VYARSYSVRWNWKRLQCAAGSLCHEAAAAAAGGGDGSDDDDNAPKENDGRCGQVVGF